jgi:hypothetical protein
MTLVRDRAQEPGHHHFTECPMYNAKPSEVYTGPPDLATTQSGVICLCFDDSPEWTLG